MALVTPWRCAATLWVLAPRVAGWAAPASQFACHVGRWRLLLRRGAAHCDTQRAGRVRGNNTDRRIQSLRDGRLISVAWLRMWECHPTVGRSCVLTERLRLGSRVSLSGWVAVVAGLQTAALVVTSSRYGYHGDEFYFIVAGSHPAFGYPDQPPLVPLLSWLMHELAPGSLLVLRLPSAIVGGTTTLLAALVAREVGGSRRAQLIAAACTAVSGFALAASHLTSTTTFDLLSTTAFVWLVIRALVRHSGASFSPLVLLSGLGSRRSRRWEWSRWSPRPRSPRSGRAGLCAAGGRQPARRRRCCWPLPI